MGGLDGFRDGVDYFFDAEHKNEAPDTLALAAEMAFERGGQTTPVSDYDVDNARESITGERTEISRLHARIAHLQQYTEHRPTCPARSKPIDRVSPRVCDCGLE